MDVITQVVWLIGLVVALGLTLAILKAVLLTLNALAGLHELGVRIRDAARGVAANVAAEEELRTLEPAARALHEAASQLSSATRILEGRAATLVGGSRTPRGSR